MPPPVNGGTKGPEQGAEARSVGAPERQREWDLGRGDVALP